MSKNPKIYGFCDAGCKWETVHKDDFDRSAAFVAMPIQGGDTFVLEPLKTYRVKKATSLANSGLGFHLFVAYTLGTDKFAKCIYDPDDVPVTDPFGQYYNFDFAWKEFVTVRLCTVERSSNARVAVVEIDGKAYYWILSTEATEGEVYEDIHINVVDSDECYLVNEHAEILARAGEVPTAINLSEFDTTGKIVETYPDGTKRTTTMEFDGNGNPVKITDAYGNETVITW